MPFDIISYGAGLTAMRFVPFFAATFAGMVPGTFIYSLLGQTLVPQLTTISYIIGGGVIAALIGLFIFGKRPGKKI